MKETKMDGNGNDVRKREDTETKIRSGAWVVDFVWVFSLVHDLRNI
ncbi:MAG: hypothetical protein OEX77_10875 [Candidatus Bathyarchaeota archaeon]|nr:hypothetical protein [Candidatus Bathyarchaeota archaeon]MDH5732908.1 hypothetical protein [Candidatus Bathyarchaeota archaeon]